MTRTVRISAAKRHVLCRKRLQGDTGWRTDAVQPRFGPYENTRPCPAGREWRSFALEADGGNRYRLFVEADPRRGKWKAVLIAVPATGAPVALLRLEDQPGMRGGGLHVHAHCDSDLERDGAASLDMPYVLPDHGRPRRRRPGWTKAAFCSAAGRFFRADLPALQEELDL